MKFMKLGTRADTFYTEESTRTVISDVPSDLTIRINNITFLLHKYPLLPKCGLLQRLYTESDDASNVTLNLDDIPGGGEAFELCAKFCYGISINLSAHNYVSAFCAAKFLRMTEAVENGNFVMKLEAFFSSCILEGWKDPIVALQNTGSVYEWSENLGIVRRCIESIVDKILTPPAKVAWSYTYTRPGYEKKRHQSVPKDWWTEDISFLDIDIFRCILAAIKSTNILQPQLVGESLHVYACRWLPDITQDRPQNECSTSTTRVEEQRKILETIVGLIPADKGSVSIKFLLKLLSFSNLITVSTVTKAELLRLSGLQLEEAKVSDLVISGSDNRTVFNDVDLVKTVLESFLRQWRRQRPEDGNLRSIRKVGKLIDSYMQVVAKDANVPVGKVASLAETMPGIGRPNHDDLYVAIDVYLKEHPDISKTDKKQLCRALDCQKLSPEVRAHAVRNERLPLRTVVQVLFFEQEKNNNTTTTTNKKQISPDQLIDRQQPAVTKDELQSANGAFQKGRGHKLELRPEPSFKMEKGKEIRDERVSSGIQLSSREKALVRRISDKAQT
ncbi:BTB/POZ domain-containing protein at5g47800 [Phtheirospermum japonicum]|uniref:BTB/POZ domain-containing protein at5g47800 n=1 Tax=Phtheirospermum japonicum TaxID=374723 RepID=A0A830C120_9LAMI|nr:BTB/POZ domain-containing protein at5g47800 [Phtheirospermum japonicum]